MPAIPLVLKKLFLKPASVPIILFHTTLKPAKQVQLVWLGYGRVEYGLDRVGLLKMGVELNLNLVVDEDSLVGIRRVELNGKYTFSSLVVNYKDYVYVLVVEYVL